MTQFKKGHKNPFRIGECPVCHAEDGKGCKNVPFHQERMKPVNQDRNLKPTHEKIPINGVGSYVCRKGEHKRCRGFVKMNHGLTQKCGCRCHKQESAVSVSFSEATRNEAS
jgi:hypothetical protein